MGAFFSATDWSQLEDRGVLSNYLLMLIVNFKGEYVAKVAFKAKRNGEQATTLEFANNLDGFEPLSLGGKKEKDVLVVMDCKIEFETTVVPIEPSFASRYEAVKKAVEDAKPKYTPPNYGTGAYGGYGGYGGGGNYNGISYTGKEWQQGELGLSAEGFEWDEGNKSQKRNKSVMEMTDEEWRKYVEEKYETKTSSKPLMSKEDAFGALNSFIEDNYLLNPESPVENLIKKNKELKTKKQLNDFLADFPLAFEEHFDILYKGASAWDYIQILTLLEGHLKTYEYNRLIKGIVEELTYMILAETEEAVSDGPGAAGHVFVE